jgi:membrane associated rhomboid family serine protease
MIPLRDKNPSGTIPLVTVSLIGANVLVFVYQLSLGAALPHFLVRHGLVPARIFSYGETPGPNLLPMALPFLFSMFFHGGWLHLIGNMWYLWIFGDNVEDRLGHGKFLLFYLLCGFAAALTHVLLNPRSSVPCIGASGAVAGVLGAYLVCFPFARIVTLVPIFFFIQLIEIPALVLLAFWFVLQFFSGALSIAVTAQTGGGGVAWWAHVGGFLSGMVLIKVHSPRRGFRGWRG